MSKILIIDDHALIRNGIRRAFESSEHTIIGEAASKKEALAQIAHKNPDCIIVDINLPDGSGMDIVRWARKNSESIAIIVLTLHEDSQYITSALKSGASAYISKTAPLQEIVATIEHAIAAPRHFSAKHLSKAIEESHENFSLSPRELEVLMALGTSHNYKEISVNLSISQPTLKSHVGAIFRKLDVKNRLSAVNKARESGLL